MNDLYRRKPKAVRAAQVTADQNLPDLDWLRHCIAEGRLQQAKGQWVYRPLTAHPDLAHAYYTKAIYPTEWLVFDDVEDSLSIWDDKLFRATFEEVT